MVVEVGGDDCFLRSSELAINGSGCGHSWALLATAGGGGQSWVMVSWW